MITLSCIALVQLELSQGSEDSMWHQVALHGEGSEGVGVVDTHVWPNERSE